MLGAEPAVQTADTLVEDIARGGRLGGDSRVGVEERQCVLERASSEDRPAAFGGLALAHGVPSLLADLLYELVETYGVR